MSYICILQLVVHLVDIKFHEYIGTRSQYLSFIPSAARNKNNIPPDSMKRWHCAVLLHLA